MSYQTPSLEVVGYRDPAATVEIRRCAKEKGVIDLTSPDDKNSSGGKCKSQQEFSTCDGKRTESLQTANHRWSQTPSLQVVGYRNPAATVEIRRCAKEKGVIDLVSPDDKNSNGGKRKSQQEFSTCDGKRRKPLQTANHRLSTYCKKLEDKWSQGAFRWVHLAQYRPHPRVPHDDGGPQNGELCVMKEFKTGSVYEDSFFSNDILAVDKAKEFIDAFNLYHRKLLQPGKMIRLNQPAIWESLHPDSTGKTAKKLVEPKLEGKFLKFNSNSGYTSDGTEYVQALSHFSYHHSQGKHLLCDLQGGHYEDCYILTDPVVMSQNNSKEFGATDLGGEGIENFFAHHKCSSYCCGTWMKPKQPKRSGRIPVMETTSMSLEIGTKKSEVERKKKLEAILAKNKW